MKKRIIVIVLSCVFIIGIGFMINRQVESKKEEEILELSKRMNNKRHESRMDTVERKRVDK